MRGRKRVPDVKVQRLRWLGNVARMEEYIPAHILYDSVPLGRR